MSVRKTQRAGEEGRAAPCLKGSLYAAVVERQLHL